MHGRFFHCPQWNFPVDTWPLDNLLFISVKETSLSVAVVQLSELGFLQVLKLNILFTMQLTGSRAGKNTSRILPTTSWDQGRAIELHSSSEFSRTKPLSRMSPDHFPSLNPKLPQADHQNEMSVWLMSKLLGRPGQRSLSSSSSGRDIKSGIII